MNTQRVIANNVMIVGAEAHRLIETAGDEDIERLGREVQAVLSQSDDSISFVELGNKMVVLDYARIEEKRVYLFDADTYLEELSRLIEMENPHSERLADRNC